ncbi:MAG: rod shape-determining protein MreC [Candidatus Paceibacterota bacterium]|jgi:cell shape-determining protein MreC
MSFHQRNNLRIGDRANKKYILFTIVVFLIVLFSFKGVRNIFMDLASPLWKVEKSVLSFFSENMDVLRSKTSLIKENTALKEEISFNIKNKALYEVVKKENEDMKEILSRKRSNTKQILSAVLVKPFLSPYDTLIIDLGSASGISVGDKVVAFGDTYIGYIGGVSADTSKVILYSSSGEKVNVLIGKSNVLKEAIGVGGGNFTVEMPRGSEIIEGDSVVIPSISSNVFGTVEKINFKETDSFETVLFKSPVNVSELKWVEVVSKANIE